MAAPTHESLIAWQVAVELAAEVYQATEVLPDRERFGIAQQIRRAAISVSSNIAEGTGRRGRRDTAHFLIIARGSLREVESLLAVSERLGLLPSPSLTAVRTLATRTSKLLTGLLASFSN